MALAQPASRRLACWSARWQGLPLLRSLFAHSLWLVEPSPLPTAYPQLHALDQERLLLLSKLGLPGSPSQRYASPPPRSG
jgi:hypothetical protein